MSRQCRVLSAIVFVVTLLFSVAGVSHAQQQEGRLMRFPDIYKDTIVFSYAGDLWLVPSTGGTARRITTHPGLEIFPKFSPDGKTIAFTGQYDGNFNVYTIPSEGGEPKQLTFLPDPFTCPNAWDRTTKSSPGCRTARASCSSPGATRSTTGSAAFHGAR